MSRNSPRDRTLRPTESKNEIFPENKSKSFRCAIQTDTHTHRWEENGGLADSARPVLEQRTRPPSRLAGSWPVPQCVTCSEFIVMITTPNSSQPFTLTTSDIATIKRPERPTTTRGTRRCNGSTCAFFVHEEEPRARARSAHSSAAEIFNRKEHSWLVRSLREEAVARGERTNTPKEISPGRGFRELHHHHQLQQQQQLQ